MPLRLLLSTVVLALLAPACGAAPPPTRHPAEPALAVLQEIRSGRQVTLTLRSPALRGTATAEVLLPAGWRPGTRWPVLYLLEGCCHTRIEWITLGRAGELTEDAGVIVVIPEGGRAGFYSDWVNGPKWETFHLTELRRLIETRYGATDRRAIAGLSMGGFGALSYAARHPGMFRAAASFSGLTDVSRADADWITRQSGENSHDLWRDQDIPLRNPMALVARLRDIPVYVSCGNGEKGPLDPEGTPKDEGEAVIERQNRAFVAAARAAGVKVTANLYGPGTHSWPYWTRELRRALPLLLGELR
ncbi:alpha/beta hydrolase [Thermoactinospora rubra]|uniref:alpha/beta hydrolase n=1 Tax=Thermoactinospora rubra TaxID=1088767 RepID=UPI001301F339|nr:alpha/beta hydrolase family protein [Thermoactinospora rubra]